MLRASTDPHDLQIPQDLLTSDPRSVGLRWLSRLWARPDVRHALTAANPGLCAQVTDLLDSQRPNERRARKVLLSMAAYLARWGRPTPFALFAGTAPVTVGDTPRAVWGGDHSVHTRADTEWLADVITRLHRCRTLAERLDVVTNNTGQLRGNWFVVPGQSADGHAHLAAPVEASVRYSPPVASALTAARTPLRYRQLLDQLTRDFPSADRQRVTALLDELIDRHVLLTGLWAPMTTPDALAHLCEELTAVHAHDIAEIADLVLELQAIHAELTRPVQHSAWPDRAPVVDRMRSLTGVAPVPVIVDTALDCSVQVPQRLIRTVEEAADVLTRVSPYPFGSPQWRDYHARFRARYGPGAVVPVLELVVDSGLGWPTGYLGAGRGRPPRMLTERDHAVLSLVQKAQAEGDREIVLTETSIADLGSGTAEDIVPAPRIEMCVQVHAATPQAIAEGDFTAVVTGTPRVGSSMAGRFAHLLPADDQKILAVGYRTPQPGALAAQLVFPPRRRRNENITRTPQLLPHVIPLAQHHAPGPGVIEPSDLAVTCDAHRFYLLRLSTGQRVEPRVPHALEAGTHTPPLARFLAEITTARCAVYGAFDFGAAAQMPYLPRIRYRNAVLAPARWILSTRDFPGPTKVTNEWEDGFARWRSKWRVPDHVALVEHDRRLPLDLSHPVHRQLLRQRLGHHTRVELSEAPGPEQTAWLGRPHELLVPLHAPPTGPAPAPTTSMRPVHGEETQLPGGAVLCVRLYTHSERFNEILTDHLPALTRHLPPTARSWFRRHRDLVRPDADQYLELYTRLPEPDQYADAVERLHSWARELRCHRLLAHLTLDTYQPQTGRFGHGSAMEAAEAVFATDSAAALTQIRTSLHSGVDPQVLAAAGVVDLVTRFAGSPEDGSAWLIHDLPHIRGTVDRDVRRQVLALAGPESDDAALHRIGGGAVAEAWRERATALTDYRKHLATQRDPNTVLRSLIHLHHVRALGVSPDQEAATIRTARAVALARTARRSS
ncbi:hypothetical protein ADL05_01740 [Nocardiopsis sp. NRRL B-16309]|nr:hypothetical protein ADL05_01740 [Nocardiopsis sp. NRRL B-16309]